jgi:rhodanese-related sulfurtransferase
MLFAVTLLISCQGRPVTGETVESAGGSYQNISSDELHTMLGSKDFVLINVHIPFAGDIPDTDLSIAFDQIASPGLLSDLPADKNAKVVLYCQSGRMSEIAAVNLVSLGYTNVWNLEGGMVGWQEAGYTLEE